mmetsp:Transcript_21818/g.31859  ORF Transcript_21818/g.31859 Transcript_21818/m.31859 type:complete len:226 (+) Transcript_21818:183-860(+)|eukprot:CAMPEP_0197247156 /NCGR_PEP_ID=MMETSP1429-20130617/26137_1 /TAXON_ID=49237 /ORGANISM="Chaetoceros  sp., Strain UNC1202" /LENGTH=225 /DNA_ID=CAMNT_0042707993 /DNA_START=157 /DNA_END=834 /DNA_ORIENTATION=-
MKSITFLLIALFACFQCALSAPLSADVGKPVTEEKVKGVITLTSRNFDSSISDGNSWLVEFYSPWCGHCKRFAPTYDSVATTLHQTTQNDERKIMVAKVDGSKEKALASRFSVRGYPSFFLVDGWDVYEFEGSRSKEAMIKFAKKPAQNLEPIPFLTSPFGPFGQIRALMVTVGSLILDGYNYLVKTKSFSPTVASLLMAGVGVTIGTLIVIVVGLMLLPKPKID